MKGKRVLFNSTGLLICGILLPVLAGVVLYLDWPGADRARITIVNDLPIDESGANPAGRWNAQSIAAHVSASMSIRPGEEAGHYQVELMYSHCLGTQIAIRDAHLQGGRLVLAEPFTYDDIATSLGVDPDAPMTERPGIDAFRVRSLKNRPLLIPEHYFDHASIRYFDWGPSRVSAFYGFIHRDDVDDPERLARIPADSEFEVVDLNAIFYRTR